MKRKLIAGVNQDTLFLGLMDELLREEGYDTVILKASGKAYQDIKHRQPALVVLDIRINDPEAGFTVIDLLRIDPQTAYIPIIICSTATQIIRENEQRLRDKGCEILMKPFNIEELLALIATIIGPP